MTLPDQTPSQAHRRRALPSGTPITQQDGGEVRRTVTLLALLDKITDDRAWTREAACATEACPPMCRRDHYHITPELFFPRNTPTSWDETRAAKAVCARCPVLERCREEHTDELYGVWGGESAEERRARRNGR